MVSERSPRNTEPDSISTLLLLLKIEKALMKLSYNCLFKVRKYYSEGDIKTYREGASFDVLLTCMSTEALVGADAYCGNAHRHGSVTVG